jgi:uncharacterized protein
VADSLAEKPSRLHGLLATLQSAGVAFSRGVDSSCLLAAAVDVLGPEGVLAVTAGSATYTDWEREEAQKLAGALGARHRIIPTGEMMDPCFVANAPDRCTCCKGALLCELQEIAHEKRLRSVVLGRQYVTWGTTDPPCMPRASWECTLRFRKRD